mgnify:CR=1 FL=1
MTLKIIFMGTPKFSVPILKSIHDADYDIIQVYTQPPKKKTAVKKLIKLLYIIILILKKLM